MAGRHPLRTIFFIRHGLTEGNKKGRYIGRTDEPLCPEGVRTAEELSKKNLSADFVFTSPYRRCRETAKILFPGQSITEVTDLRECDFGIFEGKSYEELKDLPAYGEWLKTDCTSVIPGGESVEEFKGRCLRAFRETLAEVPDKKSAAYVIHGGSIMAILEKNAFPHRDFGEYHIGNCGILSCREEGGILKDIGVLSC